MKKNLTIIKNKLMTITLTILMLFSAFVTLPQTIKASPDNKIDVSKTSGLTCGETIWVNVTDGGLIENTRYYVLIWDGIGWENIANKKADSDGDIAIQINIPYRNPLGKYDVSLWDSSDDSGIQYGKSIRLWIENTYKIIYKVEDLSVEYVIFNKTYEYPEEFKILVYNWTGSEYELLKKSVTITLYNPKGNKELSKITSTGIWDIDYTFNYKDGDNLETYYWVNATRSSLGEYSNYTLPVKLDFTATIPSEKIWGDEITITGYVKDGKGQGIDDYTVKLYSPLLNSYKEMDSAITYSSGRYTLSSATNINDGNAGVWYIGTEMSGLYRIDESDKLNIPDFIQYHTLSIESDNSASVSIVSPDEITTGFTQIINVSVKWNDELLENAWIHISGLKAIYNDIDYEYDDIIVIGNGHASSIQDEYAYYEFQIKFTETGTGTITVTSPFNNTIYETNDDLKANIIGSTNLDVISPDNMTLIVENMPDHVLVTETGNSWKNTSQTITIKIYGNNENSRMNASLRITGCGLDISIDENTSVTSGYWQSVGEYKVDISPKIVGTLTITATNNTQGLVSSKNFEIKGLSGIVTTSVDNDLKISIGSSETVTAIIINGQYAQVHLTYFDETWKLINCIKHTTGDNTLGNGLNGKFEFLITKKDLSKGIGYIIVAAKTGESLYFYDIIEITPAYDLVINMIEPEDASQYILTVGLKHNFELKVSDTYGNIVKDIDSVTGKIIDEKGNVLQRATFKGPTADNIWYIDNWIPHFAGTFTITAKNNTGGLEHQGTYTFTIKKATITYTPNKLTAGIQKQNIIVYVRGKDANDNPLPLNTKLYLNINAPGTTANVDFITLDKYGRGNFEILKVGDIKGEITTTLQSYEGDLTNGKITISLPTFKIEPSEVYIGITNTVKITVSDVNGNPLKGLYITLYPSLSNIINGQPEPVETDANGNVNISIYPLASGKLNVTIARNLKYKNGQLSWDNSIITDNFILVKSLNSLKITLSKSIVYEGENLTITVKSREKPVERVTISFADMIKLTDQNGIATFTASDPKISSNVYQITAEKTGYDSAESSVTVIKKYQILIVGPNSKLVIESTFTVTIIANNRVLPGATVTLGQQTKTSDANGKVTFTAPSKEGKYNIVATAEGYKDGKLEIEVENTERSSIPGLILIVLLGIIIAVLILLLIPRKKGQKDEKT